MQRDWFEVDQDLTRVLHNYSATKGAECFLTILLVNFSSGDDKIIMQWDMATGFILISDDEVWRLKHSHKNGFKTAWKFSNWLKCLQLENYFTRILVKLTVIFFEDLTSIILEATILWKMSIHGKQLIRVHIV